MRKNKIDPDALRHIKQELIKDGFLTADGRLTEKGMKEAEKRRIKNPGADALIFSIARTSTSLPFFRGKLTGAVIPVSRKKSLSEKVRGWVKGFRKK